MELLQKLIAENKWVEWVFSGIGATVLALIAGYLWKSKGESPTNTNTNNITINNGISSQNSQNNTSNLRDLSIEELKRKVFILFIDDDSKFKVSAILKKSGWLNTKLVKDVASLDDIDVANANILFIDIQGVGIKMSFQDEGLGLALAIKDRFPNKKVVIYSAENKGDRFHKALKTADACLSKNADPYEFEKLVHDLSLAI